jgi:hypothetical protein
VRPSTLRVLLQNMEPVLALPPPKEDPGLPREIWEMILGHLPKGEEFQAASVCRDWYEYMCRRREKRGEVLWETMVRSVCNTVPRLQWAQVHGCPWNALTMVAIAQEGSPAVVGYALTNGCEWTSVAAEIAAFNGNLPFLEEVMKFNGDLFWGLSDDTWACAAEGGALDILKWGRENGYMNFIANAMDMAAREGHVDIMRYLHEERFTLNEDTCMAAAYGGKLECLKFARSVGISFADRQGGYMRGVCISLAAASSGSLECLVYVHTNGAQLPTKVPWVVLKNGNLECLKYLMENGSCIDDMATRKLVTYGQVQCLQYIKEFGAPLHADICTQAAGLGQLEALKWAHESGFPWDASTYVAAIHGRNSAVLDYLDENGCPR